MKLDNSDYITELACYATALHRFVIHRRKLYVLTDAEIAIREALKPFVDRSDPESWFRIAEAVQRAITAQIEGHRDHQTL